MSIVVCVLRVSSRDDFPVKCFTRWFYQVSVAASTPFSSRAGSTACSKQEKAREEPTWSAESMNACESSSVTDQDFPTGILLDRAAQHSSQLAEAKRAPGRHTCIPFSFHDLTQPHVFTDLSSSSPITSSDVQAVVSVRPATDLNLGIVNTGLDIAPPSSTCKRHSSTSACAQDPGSRSPGRIRPGLRLPPPLLLDALP